MRSTYLFLLVLALSGFGSVGCAPAVEAQLGVLSPELEAQIVTELSPKIESKVLTTIQPKLEILAKKTMEATSGDITPSGDGWKVTIGSLNVDGSTVAFVVLAAAAVFVAWLWKSRNGFKAATDVLVKHNIESNMPVEELDHIQLKALAGNAEPYLKSRVKALSPKR